jgi:hypothetical protein
MTKNSKLSAPAASPANLPVIVRFSLALLKSMENTQLEHKAATADLSSKDAYQLAANCLNLAHYEIKRAADGDPTTHAKIMLQAASPSRGNEAPHNSVTVRFGFGEFDVSTLKEDEFVTASGLNDGGWVVCKRLPSTPEETGPPPMEETRKPLAWQIKSGRRIYLFAKEPKVEPVYEYGGIQIGAISFDEMDAGGRSLKRHRRSRSKDR